MGGNDALGAGSFTAARLINQLGARPQGVEWSGAGCGKVGVLEKRHLPPKRACRNRKRSVTHRTQLLTLCDGEDTRSRWN